MDRKRRDEFMLDCSFILAMCVIAFGFWTFTL